MKKFEYWNAIVIAVLGGAIGLQEFYLKRWVFGVLSVLFCWTYVPLVVAFVEAMVWLFEGEESFNKRFNSKPEVAVENSEKETVEE